jgi:uncharacterized protein
MANPNSPISQEGRNVPEHPIIHVELSSADPAESAEFYNKLFGWQMQHIPEMNYWTFSTEENHGGGFNPIGNPDGQTEIKVGDVIIYVYTEDLDADLARAVELGGKVLRARTDIPGMGWFAHFEDPTGNRVGLFQGVEMPEGQKAPEEQAVTV